MMKAGTLSLAALCSCAIDARNVEVPPACVSPPADGLISDFSTSRLGRCSLATCPEALESSPIVSLGTAGVSGIVCPYEQPDTVVLDLGLTGDLHVASDATSALQVVMSYDAQDHVPPPRVGVFALSLTSCLDTSGFTSVSFRVDGDLGTCPLRAATLFRERGSRTPDATCPFASCFAEPSVPVSPGLTTLALLLPDPLGGPSPALLGLQWEFDLPSDDRRTCDANFTVDDIRLGR